MKDTLAISAIAFIALMSSASAQSSAWAVAKENLLRMQERPEFVSGPDAVLPAAERQLGHHGTAVIQGILGTDGRLSELSVKVSSNAPVLDQIALDAAKAYVFSPAKDATGAPLPVTISVPFEFAAYKTATGGAFEYRCEQFVRDMDWWKSVNPDRPFSDHELYKLYNGLVIAGLYAQGGSAARVSVDFDKLWQASLETCRKKPRMLQKDSLLQH